MQQLQNAVGRLIDEFLESMEARECAQCSMNCLCIFIGNDLTVLLKRLKENIIAEIEMGYIRSGKEDVPDSSTALIKLKIVLLRKINKLLENGAEEERNTVKAKELGNLNKAVADIETKLNSKENSNFSEIEKRNDILHLRKGDPMSPPNKSLMLASPNLSTPVQISQSPLFLANKTFRFEFGEPTLTSLELAQQKEAAVDTSYSLFPKFDIRANAAVNETIQEVTDETVREQAHLMNSDVSAKLGKEEMETEKDKPAESNVEKTENTAPSCICEPVRIRKERSVPASKPDSPRKVLDDVLGKDALNTQAKLDLSNKKKVKSEKYKASRNVEFSTNSCKAVKTKCVTVGNLIKEASRSRSSQPGIRSKSGQSSDKPIKVVKKVKFFNKENINTNIMQNEERKGEVKCLPLLEPQLKIMENEALKSKLEASIRKTPLSQVNSMLNKIKLGEI